MDLYGDRTSGDLDECSRVRLVSRLSSFRTTQARLDMDGDPAVEPEFDAFSRVFPLPFRVATIVVLGVWAWGANLHYLHVLKIVRCPRMHRQGSA